MKVSGPGRIDPSAAAKAKPGAAAPGFHVDRGVGAAAPHAAPATAGLSGVNALLALQTVPSATERRKRAVRRANDLLDVLGEVRVGLLEGAIDPGQLDRLRRMTAQGRDEVEEPGLRDVLDEIDLRAQVELAKLGIYS